MMYRNRRKFKEQIAHSLE